MISHYFNSFQTLSTKWKPPPADGCAVGLLMGDKVLVVSFQSGKLPEQHCVRYAIAMAKTVIFFIKHLILLQ